MGKGARKRARRARAAQRPNKAARRARASTERAEQLARLALVLSPEADPPIIASQLAEHLLSVTDMTVLAGEMLDRHGAERTRAIAEALLTATGETPSAVAFAAKLHHLAGDDARSAELLERLHAASDDPSAAVALAGVWTDQGRRADALELLWDVCARDPLDLDAQGRRGELLAWMRTEATDAREAALLGRFRDGTPADELTDTAIEMIHRFDEHLDDAYEDWYGSAAARHRPAVENPDEGLLMERLLTLGIERDDDDDCIYARLAADPATPPDLARRARDRHERGLWGLWEIREEHDDLGAWVIELMTGLELYVDPGDTGPLPRWTVLLGPAYPDDGVWRLGMCERLTPQEAEALVPHILEVTNVLVADLTTGRRGRRRAPRMEHDPSLPASVRAEVFPEPETAPMMSTFIAGALPHLMGLVRGWRAMPAEIRNSDGDPVELITLEIDVADPDVVRAALAARADIDGDAALGEFVWQGREVPAGEAAVGIAQMRAQGLEPTPMDGPQHYVRATFRFEGARVRVDVNSRARRDGAIRILEEAGARPRVHSESRIEPALYLPAPGEAVGAPSASDGMSKEAIEAWQRSWPDEPVPALDGLTPREAAASDQHLARLISLLRQFEHHADRARLAGHPAADIEALRDELLGDRAG